MIYVILWKKQIQKILQIFDYLDDNYGLEYIKYKFTYNYIDIILEQYNYKEITGSISNKLIDMFIINTIDNICNKNGRQQK